MKVAFVKPPVGGILGLEMLTFVEPLGPICVAACLEAEGHECKVYDLRIDGEEHGLALCRTSNLPVALPVLAASLGPAYALRGRTSDAIHLLEQATCSPSGASHKPIGSSHNRARSSGWARK